MKSNSAFHPSFKSFSFRRQSQTRIVLCLLSLLSLESIVSAADELVLLPVIGAEVIDGRMVIASPAGDSNPRQGSGRVLRPNTTETALDYLGVSVVVDLGQMQLVQRVELCSTNNTNGKIQNLNESTLELYASTDNVTFERVRGYKYNARAVEKDDFVGLRGSASKKIRIHNVIELSGLQLSTRYLKVHSTYKGRDYDFVAPPDRMIRAFGQPGVPEGERVRLPLGLLQAGVNKIGVNAKHFKKLPNLRCHIRLQLLGGGPEVVGIEKDIPLDPKGQNSWHEVEINVPDCEPGLYRLTVERIDESKNLSLWVDEQEPRVVGSVRQIEAANNEEETNSAAHPGECLLIRPEKVSGGWSVDSADPEFPLWRGHGALKIPVRLKGSYVVYVGLLGPENCLALEVGEQRMVPISSRKASSDAMHEAYLGIVENVEASSLTIHLGDQDAGPAIAWIKLLALTPRQVRLARGEEDLSKSRKLIYVSDGASWFGAFDHKPKRTVQDLEAKVEIFEGSDMVERFDWCPGTSSVIYGYPTKVGQLIRKRASYALRYDKYITENILEFIEQGNPPLKVIADASRRNGLECYAAIRMAAYYTPPSADVYNSDFWREHPEYRIQYHDGRQYECLSYAFPEVRKLYLDLMREMLDYGIGGIHFEFLRDSTLLGFERPVVESYQRKYGKSPLDPDFEEWERWYQHRAAIMTEFVRSVRSMLDEEGQKRHKRFGISARIPCYDYFEAGLDPKTWMAERLVDMVAPGSNQLPNRPMPLELFVEMARGSSCKVYSSFEDAMGDGRDPQPSDDEAGIDPGWHSHASKDESRDFVIQEFRKGALGIYRFNSEGNDWKLYENLERWDEFENPRRLLTVPYNPLN